MEGKVDMLSVSERIANVEAQIALAEQRRQQVYRRARRTMLTIIFLSLLLLLLGLLFAQPRSVGAYFSKSFYQLAPHVPFYYVYYNTFDESELWGIQGYPAYEANCWVQFMFPNESNTPNGDWSGPIFMEQFSVIEERDEQWLDYQPRIECAFGYIYISTDKWYKWEAGVLPLPLMLSPLFWRGATANESAAINSYPPYPGP